MPLSKKRQAEYQKARRNRLKTVIPKAGIVIPNDDALQSISSGIKRETNSTVPPVSPEFRWQDQGKQPIPNCPDGRYRRDR